jgi:hypothetical protein
MPKPFPLENSPEFKRRAKQAIAESRKILDAIPPHARDIGDPNNPANSGLFGMETREFLARQHKESRP